MVIPLQTWTVELVGPKGYIHGWIKVGGDVEHKDSSKGVVRHYDPATQTAHVQWSSGPRASKNGGLGTTKAYHLKQGQGLGPGYEKAPGRAIDRSQGKTEDRKPVDTREMDPDQVLQYVISRGPRDAIPLNSAKLVSGPTAEEHTNAQYDQFKRVIRTNERLTDLRHTRAEVYKSKIQSRWLSARPEGVDPVLATLTHEYGHHLDFTQSKIQGPLSRDLSASLGIPEKHGYPGTPFTNEDKAKIEREVGKYAASNRRELHAELYAEYMLSPRPSRHAQIVGKYLHPEGPNRAKTKTEPKVETPNKAGQAWERVAQDYFGLSDKQRSEVDKLSPGQREVYHRFHLAGHPHSTALEQARAVAKAERPKVSAPKSGARKHGWVQPGLTVLHKDGSRGTVRSYDPNTQTLHVDWWAGKRAGTSGTTKAYHITAHGDAVRTKTEPKPQTAEKPTKPKTQDERLRERDEADLRAIGLQPVTGRETHAELVDKLASHYQARDKANDTIRNPSASTERAQAYRALDLIDSHHLQSGVAQFDYATHNAANGVKAIHRAKVAAYATELHRTVPNHPAGRQPVYRIASGKQLAQEASQNEHTRAAGVAGIYIRQRHEISISKEAVARVEELGNQRERGQFSQSGNASFLQRAITHEYGHSLDLNKSILGRSAMFQAVSQKMPGASPYFASSSLPTVSQERIEHRDIASWMDQNKPTIVNKVGTYASTNHMELMAELYTEGKLSEQASPAAKEAVRRLEGGS